MANLITIVEYHYVRNLRSSNYPEIKGLDVELFNSQLDFIRKRYRVIRMEDLLEAVLFHEKLPENALLLTFDDGYRDHLEYVLPILRERKLQGTFFPPASIVEGRSVLDVNKIHFVLAAVAEKEKIIKDIFFLLDKHRVQYHLPSNNHYYNTLCRPGRFDAKEPAFIKRILQKALPEELRSTIINVLFATYVSDDEASFSQELYMNLKEIQYMRSEGMYIGGHGYHHYWLDSVSSERQEKEIRLTFEFLKRVGYGNLGWVMCYPYGACNETLIATVKKYGCVLGFIEDARVADLEKDSPFSLPRLDTNYIPQTV